MKIAELGIKHCDILYFIKGTKPSTKEKIDAMSMQGAKVMFRNALHVPANATCLENCDGVAGCVPEVYAEKFPRAEDAIKANVEKLKALSAKIGDEKAPEKAPKETAKGINWKKNE